MSYKDITPYEKRAAEARRVRERYPGNVPLLVEKHSGCRLPDLPNLKYLVSREMTVGQFSYVIRRKMALDPSHALFVLFAKKLLPTSALMGNVYDEHAEDDGLLYAVYRQDSAYG